MQQIEEIEIWLGFISWLGSGLELGARKSGEKGLS